MGRREGREGEREKGERKEGGGKGKRDKEGARGE